MYPGLIYRALLALVRAQLRQRDYLTSDEIDALKRSEEELAREAIMEIADDLCIGPC